MSLRQPNWTRILTILLVILATYAVLFVTFSILARFKQAILIFLIGTIVAYILNPLVNRLDYALRMRWLAILVSYLFVIAALIALVVLLFTPFINQSKSLINNLHNPSHASLANVTTLKGDASAVYQSIRQQNLILARYSLDRSVATRRILETDRLMGTLQRDLTVVQQGHVAAPGSRRQARRSGAIPQPYTRVPPSLVSRVSAPFLQLEALYQQAATTRIGSRTQMNPATLSRALAQARNVNNAAINLERTVATTPVLVLRAQTWLDQHNIHLDLHAKFGQAARQISDQGTNLLNNAITILSETATILLDIVLIIIISLYLMASGGRMIRSALNLVPESFHDQASFFVHSLDQVLGGYIRGQIILALVAGILGGGGAALLNVPYPLLIGITTGLLELVPIIGPMITVIPAVLISLFFDPLPTTLILLAWFLVFQQLVTNVIGPRVLGIAVGIHPLEALLAVLVGFPLGGLLGAFLAVPLAGLIHVLVREAYGYFVLGHPEQPTPIPPERLGVRSK